jgi:CPA1 family monovalent cation:H+ antiporter
MARARALEVGLASLADDSSPDAETVRREFAVHLGVALTGVGEADGHVAHRRIHRTALQAARQAVIAMRAADEIGDDAFHQMEEQLDRLEMADDGSGDPGGENGGDA